MPTPAKGYWLNGKRVPSVSTILGNAGWGNDALMDWAAKQTVTNLINASVDVRGQTVEAVMSEHAYTKTRQEAADVGTCAHAMCDAFLTEGTFDMDAFPQPIVDAAMPAYQAFRQWAADQHLDVINTEFPLVSANHRYGGTPDALVKLGRDHVLLDFKTSNWLVPKHILQVCAYMDLVAECMDITCDRAIVIQIRKDGHLATMEVEGETIRRGREAFYYLLQLHRLKPSFEAITKSVNKPGAIPKSAVLTFMGERVA